MSVVHLFASLGSDESHRTPADVARLTAEDAALVANIRDGDEAAFERVYRAYHAAMWDIAHRYMRDPDSAEDVVHDVFRMVWERRATLSVESTLAVYLFGAVRHRALNVLRHTGVVRRAAEGFETDDVPALGAPPPHADADATARDLERYVLRYVDALPERTRTLVLLRWRHRLSYPEIAVALGMSPEAAKKLGQRVQNVLRPLLDELRSA